MSIAKKLSLLIVIVVIVNCGYIIQSSYANHQNQRGYIIYCPCMGRFGNQAEQLLGSLYFAKLTNRTLVLPPFIYYGSKPELIPFDHVIYAEPLKSYHDVILARDFMDQVAPRVWPQDKRKFYCPRPRDSDSCAVLKGQPFETFWASANVSKYKSIFYKPLTTKPGDAKGWQNHFPIDSHPVLAFVGAPSSFPADENSIQAQKYVHLSYKIKFEAEMFKVSQGFAKQPYLSMHIRHGNDWKKACEKLRSDNMSLFFSSHQCTGYNIDEKHLLRYKTCYPSFEDMAHTLDSTLKAHEKTVVTNIVHIATDFNDMQLWTKFRTRFPHITFIMNPEAFNDMMGAMIDIYLMTHADIFIGNCISSFSAFPARLRSEQLNLKHRTSYIDYTYKLDPNQADRSDEL